MMLVLVVIVVVFLCLLFVVVTVFVSLVCLSPLKEKKSLKRSDLHPLPLISVCKHCTCMYRCE